MAKMLRSEILTIYAFRNEMFISNKLIILEHHGMNCDLICIENRLQWPILWYV